MIYQLIMFQKEVFPDSRWGTYGTHSQFHEQEFDSEWYDNEEQLISSIIDTIARFKAENPNGEVYLHKVIDESCEHIISKGVRESLEIIAIKERLEKEKAFIEKQKEKEVTKEREIKKLLELQAKYGAIQEIKNNYE